MDVGLALPYSDGSVPGEAPLEWSTVEAWARRAEELDFASVWLADHLYSDITKYGGPPARHATVDPLVGLAALARRTTRVALGTLVLCTQLRAPTIAAKMLATVDVLSEGRLIVGMGAGWQRGDFEAADVEFEPLAVRLEQLGEAIELMARLLAGDHVTFTGRHYRAEDARFLPHPRQRPRPPIWAGGRSDGVLDVVARVADGWNTCWRMTPDEYRGRVDALSRACEANGRDPTTVTRTLGLYALVGEDERDLEARFRRMCELVPQGVVSGSLTEWRRGRLVGTVGQVREQLATWAELSVATVIVSLGALPFSVTTLDDLEMVAAACNRS